MSGASIDLHSDPEIPLGRELMEQLVGAHMVAADEQELLHLVRHVFEPATIASADYGRRILTHAAYRGQALIVRLLDLVTCLLHELEEAGVEVEAVPRLRSERGNKQRLDIWLGLLEEDI